MYVGRYLPNVVGSGSVQGMQHKTGQFDFATIRCRIN